MFHKTVKLRILSQNIPDHPDFLCKLYSLALTGFHGDLKKRFPICLGN